MAEAAGTNRIDRGREEVADAEEGPRTPMCDSYTYALYGGLLCSRVCGTWKRDRRKKEKRRQYVSDSVTGH